MPPSTLSWDTRIAQHTHTRTSTEWMTCFVQDTGATRMSGPSSHPSNRDAKRAKHSMSDVVVGGDVNVAGTDITNVAEDASSAKSSAPRSAPPGTVKRKRPKASDKGNKASTVEADSSDEERERLGKQAPPPSKPAQPPSKQAQPPSEPAQPPSEPAQPPSEPAQPPSKPAQSKPATTTPVPATTAGGKKPAKAKWQAVGSEHVIQVGTVVKAKYYADPKRAPYGQSSYKNHFYRGKVDSCNEDMVSCTVAYDDGAVEEDVLFTSLKIYI